jgi:hypothetical protein
VIIEVVVNLAVTYTGQQVPTFMSVRAYSMAYELVLLSDLS